MIQLNDDQKEALLQIKNFIQSDEVFFVLTGSAGTGKTTLVKYILEYCSLNYHPTSIAAPTHKAANVLRDILGHEAQITTLHQLLQLEANIELDSVDLKNLDFKKKNRATNKFPYKGLVIVDETSMITNELTDILLMTAQENKTKLLFVGDKAQLKPVRQKTPNTMFVSDIDNKYELTKIMRQTKKATALSELLQYIRTTKKVTLKDIKKIKKDHPDDKSIQIIKDVDYLKEAFSKIHSNYSQARVLSFTNDRVAYYNNIIKRMISTDRQPYVSKNDLLMAYDSIGYVAEGVYYIYNSMDYKVVEMKPGEKSIDIAGNTYNLTGSYIDVVPLNNESDPYTIFYVEKDKLQFDPKAYQEYIKVTKAIIDFNEYTIKIAKSTNNYAEKGQIWRRYFTTVESFESNMDIVQPKRRAVIKKKSFDFGYAHTIHKSQGSTYNEIILDFEDLTKVRNLSDYKELLYVALSRAKSKITVLV